MKMIKYTLLILVFFVGTVVMAVPTKINNRTEYSTALNSIASIVMNWYGSLISDNENQADVLFDPTLVGDTWSDYRSKYPKNITHVMITSTKLRKLIDSEVITNEQKYQFIVKSLISFKDNMVHKTQLFNETFIFESDKINQSIVDRLKVKSVVKNNSSETEFTEGKAYNRFHYKVREFTYAWLSYLDGVQFLKHTMNADAWLKTAQYSIDIANDKKTGSIASIIKQRQKLLAKGGHLLRSLDIKNQTADGFTIELILEWKGVNTDGKAVLAKIRQRLKVKINKDKSWELITIKEKHLLPVIAPWMGMLC